jgi:pilus assembly protein TadC
MSFGMMVIAAWAVIKALEWPLTTALFPVVIGIPIFILATSELFSSLSKREETTREVSAKGASSKEEKPDRLPVDRTLLAFLLILSFFLLILLVGFPIAVPLFVFFYMKIYGREKWVLSVGIAAVTWAGFYGLFVLVSNIHFGEGWLQQGLRALGIW